MRPDKQNLTLMVAEFRRQLDTYGFSVGRRYALSAFLPADPAQVAGLPLPQVFVLASRLVNELAEADNDRELTRVIARYGRVDLLCLDLCRHRDYAEVLHRRLSVA